MKICIDCRFSGKSGIGSFIDGLLPHFASSCDELFLLGEPSDSSLADKKNIHIIFCDIKAFSLKEFLFFPNSIKKLINSCDVFFTPYCNIPSGIKIPIFCTIHDIIFLDMPEIAGKIGTAIRKFFYKSAITKSKGIFTVSEHESKQVLTCGVSKCQFCGIRGIILYYCAI